MADLSEIRAAKAAHTAALMDRPNVVGVGIGRQIVNNVQTDELCLSVLVADKIAIEGLAPEALVPSQLGSVPTDVVQIGTIRANQVPTDKFRPAPGGVSIGHYQISAGTLGCIVRDRATGDRLILSNNHVLANSNDAVAGDPIIQPGGADGGTVANDLIARLERFCTIDFGTDTGSDCGIASAYAGFGNAIAGLLGSRHRVTVLQANPQAVNLVDAAVARPINDDDVLDEILNIGEVSGTVEGVLGLPIRKSGRTTGFTTGTITTIEATVSVNYGAGRVATFENQLVAGPMSEGGDSGSLIVAADSQQAVGLLFAGSTQSTIFSPIQAVLDCLNVEI
ncbi:MAG: hypothetical protein CL608_00610 [Anaerolineaceae bacterium]|nr:hypothetical protein [Anaerolineaceae bacterium]